MRLRRRVSAAVLMMLACTPPPASQNPLTPAAGAKPDPALLGRWEDQGKEKLDFEVTVKADGTMVLTSPRDGEPLVFEGHPSKIGNLTLLNLRFFEKGQASTWIFARYELRDGLLTVSTLRNGPVRKAIESGALKGVPGAGGMGDLVITDTPENITKFILGAKPETLFETFGTYRKKH